MRRILLSLSVLLLGAVTAMAQYNPKDVVEPVEGEGYLLSTTSGDSRYFVTTKGAMTTVPEDDSYVWQVEDAGNGNFYLKNVGSGQYIQDYDQAVLSEDQGGYPFDGYDIFGYAGFNFKMGSQSGAMVFTKNPSSDGTYLIERTQRVESMEQYGYSVFRLAIQNHDGAINVAMDPWGSNSNWAFMTYSEKTVLDKLMELLEYCSTLEFPAGTAVGYYDPAVADAYAATVNEVYDKAEDPDFSDYQALYDKLSDALEAVKKALIRIPNGYYFVVSANPKFAENQGADVVKGLYEDNKLAYWGNLDKNNAAFLWKIDQDASDVERYNMVNAYTKDHVTTIAQSGDCNLTDAEDGVATIIEAAYHNEFGQTYFDIRPESSPRGGYRYLHTGGHGGGTGVNGSIVGWCETYSDGSFGGTEWTFIEVDEATVQTLLDAKDAEEKQKALNAKLQEMIAQALAQYNATAEYERGAALITETSQLSSNATEPNEGSIEALIDNDPDSFWHSKWSGGTVPVNSHYLQVDLIEPAEEMVELYVRRRKAENDHVTLMTVYGSNDGDEWTYLTQVKLANATSGAEFAATPFDAKQFGKLRFWISDTYFGGGTSRGYGHFAEFQLYKSTLAEDCQLARIKDAQATKNLLAIIESASALENATQDDIDELQAAIDAFAALAVDPTALKELLVEVNSYAAGLVVGNNPGYVNQDVYEMLQEAIADAEAVLTVEYTKENVDNAIENLRSVYETVTINPIEADTWYNIRFSGIYISALPQDVEITEGGRIVEGDYMEAFSDWRFLDMGNGQYAIQNRGTGMMLTATGTFSYTSLNWNSPTKYTPRYRGNGQFEFAIQGWEGQDYGLLESYGDRWLVSHNPGNCGFYVDIAKKGADDIMSYNISVSENAAAIFTMPIEVVKVENAECYRVNGVFEEDEQLFVTLSLIDFEAGDKVAACEPFLLLGGSYDQEVGEASVPCTFTWGDVIATTPVETGTGLVGITANTKVPEGNLAVSAGRVMYLNAEKEISAWRGYITLTHVAEEGDLTIVVPNAPAGVLEDGIESTMADLAKKGDIYNAAGQIVAKNATLKDVKAMGRGIYILNGVKVIVK